MKYLHYLWKVPLYGAVLLYMLILSFFINDPEHNDHGD